MLTVSQKAKAIIDLIRRQEKIMYDEYGEVRVQFAGLEAMEREWNSDERYRDGFQTNPYTKKMEESSKKERHKYDVKQQWGEVLDFTIEHFLAMIDK
jgi:hypothetical protein